MRHDSTLSTRFQDYLLSGIPELRRIGYNPKQFDTMVRTDPIGAARSLLASDRHTSSGFATLWEKGRLDASLEFAVCLPWFRELFTDEEVKRAEWRLTEHGFDLAKVHAVTPPSWWANREPEDSAGRPETPAPSYRRRVEAEEAARAGAATVQAVRATEPVRSPVYRALVLERAGGRCENPGCAHPGFHEIGRNGDPIVEVDHVRGLKEGGPDHPANMVVLCPNCHAVKTRGPDEPVTRLRGVLARIARERHEAAMAAG
ncbi:HNH endonuclease signature motif containing protein [Kitasatospora sp. NPDC004799]|uniref:HNH endonuclease signature motif containing protein n=1 Tax=Kitasatospora sp. NPDC004799 TaxID=3154460 RepID=UPI00339F18DB